MPVARLTPSEALEAPAGQLATSSQKLSGRDAIALLEIIHRCTLCSTEQDFRALFLPLQALMAFDFAFASLGGKNRDGVVDLVAAINVNFPEGWLREYTEKCYAQIDTVISEHFARYAVPDCSDPKLERPQEIVSLGLDFGMRTGYSGGSPPMVHQRYGSMFCFKRSSKKHDWRSRTILELVAPHLHLALSRVLSAPPPVLPKNPLSNREKEVMSWLSRGKSTWDISRIIRISERTVNFHIDNIKMKLGAVNRPQAVAVAARLGLIETD